MAPLKLILIRVVPTSIPEDAVSTVLEA